MNDYPIDKYKFFVHGNTVIAETTYAKKRIKASAKCAPGDVFDLQKGKELAAARCNLKVANKRFSRATRKRKEAINDLAKARNSMTMASCYYNDSFQDYVLAENKVKELECTY